jgi:hypothetical protein
LSGPTGKFGRSAELSPTHYELSFRHQCGLYSNLEEVQWLRSHAFAQNDMTFSSTEILNFWKVDETFDPAHSVITNYLLRFDVNKSDNVGKIPFTVYLHPTSHKSS